MRFSASRLLCLDVPCLWMRTATPTPSWRPLLFPYIHASCYLLAEGETDTIFATGVYQRAPGRPQGTPVQVTWDSPHQSLLDTGKLLLKPEGEWIHPRTHRCHFKGRPFNGREGGFLGRAWLAPQRFRLALLHKLRETAPKDSMGSCGLGRATWGNCSLGTWTV